MIDGRYPNHSEESIDALLSRVLGSRTVPEELKRRHLAAARQGVAVLESPRRRPAVRIRVGASVAVALLLVAITGLVIAAVVGRDGSRSTSSAMAAAEHHFSAPPAGAGRYISARITEASPPEENMKQAVAEVWSRTQADGQVETEVLAWDANGNLLGRIVETADGHWLDLDGELYDLGDPTLRPGVKFLTSLLLYTRYLIEFEQVIAEVKSEVPDDVVVSESAREGLRTITLQSKLPRSPEDQAAVSEQLGTPPGSLGYEMAFASDSGIPVSWEMFVTDSAENRHTAIRIEFERWEELTFDEIDDAHFDTDSSKT